MKHLKLASVIVATAASAIIAAPSVALVTFDSTSGTGFVGKGDVQLAYSWNNSQLQKNVSGVSFYYEASSATTWTCTRTFTTGNGEEKEIVQNRHNETSTTGLVSSVARDNSKGKDGPITGFKLLGWAGDPVIVTDGQDVGTCPATPSGFVFDADSVATENTGGGLFVTYNNGDPVPLS